MKQVLVQVLGPVSTSRAVSGVITQKRQGVSAVNINVTHQSSVHVHVSVRESVLSINSSTKFKRINA